MTSVNSSAALSSADAMSRGRRLPQVIARQDGFTGLNNRLWHRLFDASRFGLFLDRALEDYDCNSVCAEWERWAAPLRKAREERQYARSCANVLRHEVERLRADSERARAESSAPLPGGWEKARARLRASIKKENA